MKEKLVQLLDALHPLVQMSVKWLQGNVDFPFILAAITETPRWTMTFRALHESPLIGVPMGVLLAFATARAWRKYFENPRNWWLLGFNAAAMVVAVLVISPVLYALTKSDKVDLSVTLQDHPYALIAWACMVAVSTFLPLVQLAAVMDAPVLPAATPLQVDADASATPAADSAVCTVDVQLLHDCNADVQADAPTLAQRAKQLKSEGLTNVQIGRELGVHRNKVTELLK